MCLGDQEYEYMSGHTIDGRILFPATAYLHLVWETMGLTLGVYYFELGVEFEDVKFVRATTLPKNQDVEFTVMIQPGSGRFEITEGSSVLVTGFIKIVDNVKLADIPEPHTNGYPTLLSKDFYKELRLRGYHYHGLFKSVEEARGDGLMGKVKWNSNWVSFMDCLLQIHIVGQDSRSLLLPTGIQKLLINPKAHIAALGGGLENDNVVLDVYSCKHSNILRSGGIEIRGLQASPVSRRKPPGVPVLESYQFVPHLPTPFLSTSEMARFCVQLALENVPTNKVLSVEIDSYDDREPISEYMQHALGDLPLVTAEINYLTSKDIKLGNVIVEDNKICSYKNCLFLTKTNCISDIEFLESAVYHIQEGGFLLARERNEIKLKFLNQLPQQFQLIAIVPTKEETVVVLQYNKQKLQNQQQVVKVSSRSYEWLDELRQAIKKGPVLAYSEKEELSGIVGLVNCIRKEPNGLNLKCLFIDDQRAPPFDINHQFYKSHLQLGLAVNLFKNGQWGSYKHFLLKQSAECEKQIDHCYANSLTRGDLSSMTWLYGPFNHGKPDGDLIRIQYASLNFRDVMLATGKLTAEVFGSGRLEQLCILGFEYSGLSEKNRRVMGMVMSGALATHIEADDTLLWNCPDDWTLEEAATVPVVYGTVYSAFFLTTRIENGKSILIHAGSGGIGLAAIRVAYAYGLHVFTTVSTEKKKKFLLNEFPKLKEENIGYSRDSSFEDLVMTRTFGRGVDYVLNSLADDKLHASIRCLGKGGKFLEIGKFDMANDTKIGLGNFLKEISFNAVLVDNLFHASHKEKLVSNSTY